MVDIAKLDALLKGSKAVETPKKKLPPPPPEASYLTDEWPACFDIDRFAAAPPIDVQPIIGPPATSLLIRGPEFESQRIRDCRLPNFAGRADEYHIGNCVWIEIPAAWMDASNWVGGYWRPWR